MYTRFSSPIKIAQNLKSKEMSLVVRPLKLITTKTYATLSANIKRKQLTLLKIYANSIYKISLTNYTTEAAIETKYNNANIKKTDDLTKIKNVINRLEAFYQINGYLCKEHLQLLIDQIKQGVDNCLTSEFLLFLLTATGCEMPTIKSEERMLYFQEIWQYLQRCPKLITKDHYIVKLQVLQHNQTPLEDCGGLLNEFIKVGGTSNDIFPYLLKVAGHTGNVKLATDLLKEMRSLKLFLNEHDFNSLLMAYGRSGDLKGCRAVLDSMQAASIINTVETQSTMIAIYLENNAEEIALSLIKQYQNQFDTNDVLKMLQSLNKCSNVTPELIKALIGTFKKDYLTASEVPIPLRRLCIELLHNDKLDLVCCILKNLPQIQFSENQDIDTYGVFLLNALFRNNSPIEEIIYVAMELISTGKNSRALHVTAELALKRCPPHALTIFGKLREYQEELKPHYFWPLLIYNFQYNGEAGILRTLSTMRDFHVECDIDTLWQYVLPKLSLTLSNPQLALQKFLQAGIKTSVVLEPLINHLLTQSKWLDVAPLVEKYPAKINVVELSNSLCALAIHVRATKRFYQFAKLLAVLITKSTDPKQDFIGQILVHVLTTQQRFCNDHYACLRLLSDMQKFGLTISKTAADILQKIVRDKNDSTASATKRNERFESIQQKLKEISVNYLIYNNESNLGNNFGEISESIKDTTNVSSNSTSFIKHPRDMSLKELEYHLIELEAKSMNTRGVLRRLLQLYVRDNHLEKALEVMKKCETLNVQTSPGMLANTVEMYIKRKDLPKAEENLQKLQKTFPGFLIDEHKFVDYAALLINCDQLGKAKEVLRKRSENNHIAGGDYLLKNIWNVLTNVAHLAARTKDLDSKRNLTHEMFLFLQKLGYCYSHNTVLGPIVRERLLRNDILGATIEFKQLAECYKHTPLQFELLSLLVRLCNNDENLIKQYNCSKEDAQQLLSDVTDTISTVHGQINMNSGLLLAFAESGTENQLRRLLINPQFRINEELLMRNCDHLGQEGSVQTLLRLARSCRGLNRIINELNIYEKLLNNFIKTNDCAAALNLYQQLEEDDNLKLSSNFIKNLVKLLKINNLKIPNNVALKAQILQE